MTSECRSIKADRKAGHVPPSPGMYFPECVSSSSIGVENSAHRGQYVRYAELSLRFQDTILGHLYGVRFETSQENDEF